MMYGSQAALLLLLLSALAWLIRLTWILAATAIWRRSLEPVPTPPAVEAASQQTTLRRVVTVRSARPEAFWAGVLRPRILVTDSLAHVLDESEIEEPRALPRSAGHRAASCLTQALSHL